MLMRYDLRASDLDRERAVEFLKAHYAAGRLRDHELASRTDAAYRAVALSELDRLTADLPAFAPPPAAPRRRVAPLVFFLLTAAVIALVASVPLETWLGALVLFVPLILFACLVFAPIAIPLLVLAWIGHMISRAMRPRPRPPHRVGWR
jgi:Domain of unknown function (DUF1707)